jgi:pilus assembly protein CpaE
MGKAIAIMGAKGGVGTTTVACNLAAQLHADGVGQILLVDLHLFLGDVGYRLGLEQGPTVLELLGQESPDWKSAPPHHPFGFQVLGLDPQLAHADHVSAEDVVALLDGCRASHDVVVIDCGAEVTEASLAACRYSDSRLIVSTEQRPSLIGAKRRLKVLAALEIPGILATGVINRAHPDSGVDPTQVERAVGLPIGARIRNAWQDNQTALARQQLLLQSCPGAGVTQDYSIVASNMR